MEEPSTLIGPCNPHRSDVDSWTVYHTSETPDTCVRSTRGKGPSRTGMGPVHQVRVFPRPSVFLRLSTYPFVSVFVGYSWLTPLYTSDTPTLSVLPSYYSVPNRTPTRRVPSKPLLHLKPFLNLLPWVEPPLFYDTSTSFVASSTTLPETNQVGYSSEPGFVDNWSPHGPSTTTLCNHTPKDTWSNTG